ncbi:hypothetical protein FNV43_RR05423 [Rhamnella rubrinervis]|uniref:Ubiquitin-like protease family profile domain-containing protein n=1 Tax=Rhamnella rubrinervis TaxID=2594499 RepID=A0A8K0HM44_9ROSA|nr:hypothetical protein FNV43_RR05423 [Rhamnella rubrinervis]
MAPFKRLIKASESVFHPSICINPKPITGKTKEKKARRVAKPHPPSVEDAGPLRASPNQDNHHQCIYAAKQGMDKLKDSFVGKFWQDARFCGGFIHLLLLNQVECDDTNVMEFDFHGIGASLQDLDFDESMKMLKIMSCCMSTSEAVLLRDKRMVKPNFNIIQNNECDRYQVGNLSYDVTISNLRSRIKEGQQIANYSVSGFPLAFQWKYHGVMCPRMLGWSCPSTLQYTKLAAEVFDRNDYIVKNELHSTTLELQQTYMKGFWHRPSDRKYYGPPVFRADTSQSQSTVLPSLIETVTNEGTQTASHPPSDQISNLKLQITELRSDLVAMRTELRSELQQQRNEIQNISSLVRQLVDQFVPKALVVAVWDPYTSVDDEQRAALTAFLDDQSTQFHVVEYDMMDKSSFNLILTSGGWLRDQEIDAAMYYIRKRIINNPQLFDQRCIVTDCMFWASMHGRYVKYLKKSPNEEEDELTKDADWEKEMRDSPFDMYVLGMLHVGSKSWLEIDYVYVPVNNDNKHWLAAKVNIRRRHITLYNSDIAMTGDKFQCNNAKCLSILFPYFLMVHGYYDHHSDLKSEGNYNLQPFSIKREDDANLPQQTVS